MKGEAAPAKFFVHILSSKSTMLFVESQDIKPGMRLAKPVYNRNGVLLFDRNTKLTVQNIVNLTNFGLIGIFILEPAEPLPPITRDEQEFEQLQTFYMFRLRDNLVNISKGKMPTDLATLAKDLAGHFGTLDHKVHFTQTIRSNTDFVYKHSVGVAIISAMIGHAMGLRESTLLSIVNAAFLYDFGYLYVPAEIMKKGEDITEIENSTISKYREKAYALLHADTNPYSIPSDSLAMVTQMIQAGRAEGEAVDRSKWLTGTTILTVADKFDRMTAMSLSRKPNSEISAIRSLIRKTWYRRLRNAFILCRSDAVWILRTGIKGWCWIQMSVISTIRLCCASVITRCLIWPIRRWLRPCRSRMLCIRWTTG